VSSHSNGGTIVAITPKDRDRPASGDRQDDGVWKRLVPGGISVDWVLESILLSVVTGFFIYLLLAVRDLRSDAAQLPKFTAIGGLLLVAAFIVQKLWRAIHGKQTTAAQILDTGFDEEGLSRRLIMIRTLRLTAWFSGMLAAIWLVGYHVAVPMFVFFYLVVFGESKWWGAAIAAATFFLIIYGLFDLVLDTEWPEPALLGWLS